jgi:hypothetical protein
MFTAQQLHDDGDAVEHPHGQVIHHQPQEQQGRVIWSFV